jgi:hypothetical protein
MFFYVNAFSYYKALYLLLGGISYTAAGAPGVFRHREEGGGNASPETAASVHSKGVEWVVDLYGKVVTYAVR